MNIQGKVETTSKEGELGAPQGYYWIKLADMDILISITMTVKVGEQLSIEAINTNLGLRAQRIEKIDSPEAGDYSKLVSECKEIISRFKKSAEETARAIWDLGKRIEKVETQYGQGTVKKLSTDLEIHERQLYYCIQFAEKYPRFDLVSRDFEHRSKSDTFPAWTQIRSSLAEPRKSTSLPTGKPTALPTPSQLPINPPATPGEIRHAYAPERAPLPTEGNKPARLFREILNWLQINHISEEELHVTTEHGPRTYHADFLVGRHILEVDSELHDPDRDEQRDKDLKTLGYDTVRFRDTEIQAAHKLLSCLRQVAAIEEAIPA